jgi:cob(I)alamin adenosyltransferase
MPSDDERNTDIYQRRIAKRKMGYEKKQARATWEKGLLIVHTGTGKGKSTAAFGMALRALGHGLQVGVVQFIKGSLDSGEQQAFQGFKNMDFRIMGDGFTWVTQNREQDIASAGRAWAEAERMLQDPRYAMVILDELNIVLKYQYLNLEKVLNVLANRREQLHIIVTGRHAPAELITLADLVSDIRSVKHPFREQGIKAQPGIEF